MRAAIICRRGGPEVLDVVDDLPRPELRRPDEVLVRVRAASINPIDTYIRGGALPFPIRCPHVLGGDACGTVEAVGPEVRRFKTGDAVFGLLNYVRGRGCYAEFTVFKERYLARAPGNVSPAEAAGLPLVGLTAWQGLLEISGLRAGQRVLITGGSGGVGSLAIQLAKAKGATVYTTCGPRNLEWVRQLGADEAIDYTAADFSTRPELSGLDILFDTVGGHYPRNLRLVRRGGWYVGITSLLNDTPRITPGRLVRHGLRLAAGHLLAPWGHPRVLAMHVHPSGEQLEQLRELVERGVVKPVLHATFPLSEVRQAHALVETRHARGKVVLTME